MCFLSVWCAKLYQDWNFLGLEVSIFEGATNLGLDHDDLVSSVKINSGCALTLYDHLYQNGFLDTLTTDDTFIEAYNDQVSSVWCTCNVTTCNATNSDYDCCTSSNPCGLNEGDCDNDSECNGNLICGTDNCQSLDSGWAASDFDCCMEGK